MLSTVTALRRQRPPITVISTSNLHIRSLKHPLVRLNNTVYLIPLVWPPLSYLKTKFIIMLIAKQVHRLGLHMPKANFLLNLRPLILKKWGAPRYLMGLGSFPLFCSPKVGTSGLQKCFRQSVWRGYHKCNKGFQNKMQIRF